MEAAGIIPHLIDEEPLSKLTVIYPGNNAVDMGNELTTTQVVEEPQVTWKADSGKFYTLLMVDIDAPEQYADCKHWLVVNIKGNEVKNGDVVAHYIGSGPMKDTGFHKYVFLVFEQERKLEFEEPRSPKMSAENRLQWSVKKFVEKYKLGRALAGNYYNAQWDPSVDERVKNIKMAPLLRNNI